MKNFLWELDIEKIPLGWIDNYTEALKQTPDGMPYAIKGSKFYVHPVKCRDLLVQTFNKHKKLATELKRNNSTNPDDISKLLRSDIILFNVLFTWLIDGNMVEFDFFDYKKYQHESSYLDLEIYFEEEDSPFEPITHYYPYKYLSLNK